MGIVGTVLLVLLVLWLLSSWRNAQQLARRRIELTLSDGSFWLVVDFQEMKGYSGRENTWIVRRNQNGTWETKMTTDTAERMRTELANNRFATEEEKERLAAWNRPPEDIEPQLETAWRRYTS